MPPSMTDGKLTLSRMAAGTTISTRMFLMPTGFSARPLDTDPLPVGAADAGGGVGVGLFITNLCDIRLHQNVYEGEPIWMENPSGAISLSL